ncbi:DUF4097 family beta strand repeat-containing protein [Marinoscillum furvescens]|uniref:Putative adhesin n=1 Tax=Marinoscillum furvescens DSM 4134 TaxID=1122208 RepID=A0A3D9L4L4_MARFU|nr:DUF4097 family beta strand repeat-containing protein [Marinoscillum furvescens]REE00565.1 putative adhesin [Marinoscillum furvescens DSM 4134]
MKRIIIALIVAVALMPLARAQQDQKEQFVIPLTNPKEAASISLNHINGDIAVTGYNGTEVIVTVVASGKTTDHDHHKDHDCDDCDESAVPAGMKKISVNPVELRATEENNQVDIHTESWKRKMDITLRVPTTCNLNLQTVHGTVKVSGVSGVLEISSVNGMLEFEQVSGTVVANTVNGKVKVQLEEVTAGEPMSFVTLNGDVDVTLPANVKATAKLRSDRGEIYTDFEMEMERSKKDVRNSNGEFEVAINSWVYGKINGGGPEYLFKNMNGNILVRKK